MLVNQLVALQAAFIATAPIGEVIHVPADAPTIQACINAAVSGEDECVVAPGTYNELINFLGKAITLRSSDGPEVTTIDGTELGGSVVNCITGEGPDTILDGFKITGGTYGRRGMHNGGSSPTVTNCIFTGNSGGGMLNSYSSPTVNNCTFGENTANEGGGMYNGGNPTGTSTYPTVTNCTFTGNIADSGGGMYNQLSNPTVTNCTFSKNSAENGGGMENVSSTVLVTDCLFDSNSLGFRGGENQSRGAGIYNRSSRVTVSRSTFSNNSVALSQFDGGGGMYSTDSTVVIEGCRFHKNSARHGGGILDDFGTTSVENCVFTGNSGQGGGMFGEYGFRTVRGSVFSGNVGLFGGGFETFDDLAVLDHCTFSGNATTGSGNSGSILVAYGHAVITNCILYVNIPGEIYVGPNARAEVGNTFIVGNLPSNAVDTGGNLVTYHPTFQPRFVRPPNPGPDGLWDGVNDDYGDLRLQPGSPCINAGDPDFTAAAGETDLDGHARVLCGRVDLGAYESGIADFDCDQEVDLTDFAAWGTCMLGPNDSPPDIGCESFDGNLDLDVDLRDFAIFQNSLTAP